MYKSFKWLLFFVVISLSFLSCADKIVVPDENIVHPVISDSVKISVSSFVNESGDLKLDVYSFAIPDRIVASLSNIRKVNYPLDYEIYSNEDTLVERGRRVKRIKSAYMLKRLEDLSSSSSGIKVLSSDSSSPGIEGVYNNILDKQSKANDLESYLSYYDRRLPDFPSYLGLSINASSRAKDLSVSSSRIALDLKDVFSSSEVYDYISTQNVDLLLLGTIRRRGRSILLKIGLFDKYKRDFVLRKDFSFPLRDIELNINEKIEIVSDFIISYLSSFPKGRLLLETEPSDALVFIDDLKFEKSPVSKVLPHGFHSVEILKEGYEKLSLDVYIRNAEEEKLKLVLSAMDEDLGKLAISSEPIGADVYLDLDYKGVSPLIIDDVNKGLYKVRLEKEGYKYSNKVIDFRGSENLQLFFPLEEGTNEFIDVEDLSMSYNIAKNIFLYSSFVFLTGTIYAFLYEGTYTDRLVSNVANENLYHEYISKLYQAREIRDAMLYTTIGLACFTVLFQILELYAEDINVGLTTYRRYGPYDSEDVALYFGFNF